MAYACREGKVPLGTRMVDTASPSGEGMRLLIYGDSLTAGYHSNGLRFSPWAPALRALLGVEAVDAVGHSGWTSSEMRAAMDEEAADVCGLKKPGMRLAMRTQGPFDAVVILAGTNDLASEGSPERISGSKFLALRFQGWNGLGLSVGLALARVWTGG